MIDFDKLEKFDMADYLKSDEAIAYYLETTAQEDIARIPAALGVVARACGGMTELSRKTGLSRETLYKTLAEGGNPTLETLSKILEVYGVRMSFTREAVAA